MGAQTHRAECCRHALGRRPGPFRAALACLPHQAIRTHQIAPPESALEAAGEAERPDPGAGKPVQEVPGCPARPCGTDA